MELGSNPEVGFSSFEAQFENKRTIPFPEGTVDAVDVTPPNVSNLPVLLAPGWSENQDTYKKSLKVIYDAGRRAITVGYGRRGGETEKHETYPQAELRKANQLLGILAAKGIDKVDGIFHSEGAINGLIAVALRPDKFRNIVLDKPAGLIGKDTKTKLTARFLKLLVTEVVERKPFSFSDPTNSVSSSAKTLNYIAGNPLRMLSEMDALTTQDITNLIHCLKGQGIKFSIIAAPDDPLFPVKRQIEYMKQKQEESGKKLPIEGYYSVRGGHNELSINADYHTLLAVDALNGLQRRRERLEAEKVKETS